jgi:transcription initiation factor TFIIB
MPSYIKKCPECGSINLAYKEGRGEVICKDCGLVIEEKMIDFTHEWREFDSDKAAKRGRTGAPLTYTKFDQGLGTSIGSGSDIYKLAGKSKNKYMRLQKWQHRISTAIERNLKLALAELKRVSSYLKLPNSVLEDSAEIYRNAVQRGLVRGRSMESVVAGALYAACRRHEIPRTLDELSEASGIDKKEIGRTYRFVTRELGIRILPSNPVDYIARFASALKLSAETQSKAIEILNRAQKVELTSGRGPTGIAAASLYVAALMNNEKRTQREVADVAGVTEVTIRNRYKELLSKLNLEEEIRKKNKDAFDDLE